MTYKSVNIAKSLTLFYRPDDSFVGQSIAAGTYEPYETDLFLNQIKSGDVVMNIDANIGYYSLLSSQKTGPNGHIIAIEPDPVTFSILKKNIVINHLKNITALNIAISNKKSKSLLYLSDKNYGDHRMYPDKDEPRKPISVRTNTIDNIVKLLNLKKLNLIKIDTQGFEPYVVKGAIKSLQKFTPTIFLEYWPYGYERSKANQNEMLNQLHKIYCHTIFIDEPVKTFSEPSINFINKHCQKNNQFEHANLIFTNNTKTLLKNKTEQQKYNYRFACNPEQMISYAQNAEDVVLNRIFNQKTTGFYVDIGAADPNINSVTKHFYLQGWNGINVEPVKEFYDLLTPDRPRDINLNIGIGSHIKTADFYECQTVKEWSTFSKSIFESHQKHGSKFTKRKIKINTLKNIFNKYADKTIDFLKIDVEGHEKVVLAGNDWKKYRPAIIIIESNTPKDIKCILKKVNYVFAFNDGLNQFFVSKEKALSLKKLMSPANIRDNYIPVYYHQIIDNFNNKEQDLHIKFQQQYSLVDSELKKTQTAYQEVFNREHESHQKFQQQYSLLASELKKYQNSIIFKTWQKYQTLKHKLLSFIK